MFHTDYHVLEYVDAYLHEVLTPAEAAYVERHCERCRICQAALDEARKRLAALQSVPPVEAPQELVQATLRRIERHERGRPRRQRLLAASGVALAATVLVLAALHVHYLRLTATPYDLVVLGQSQLLPGSIASLRVRLLDHTSGAALAGVPVDIELRDSGRGQAVRLAHFTTDAQGTGQPRFQLPEWGDGGYELRVTAHPAGGTEEVRETVQLKRSWKVMLSSDKPVYQPGQTIHVRSLALRRPDLKPVAEHPVTCTITDPKGNVIFKRQGATSKYGIAAGDCPLADEILEGAYTIQAQVGDTQSTLTVEVKKYVLPKFKIDVELDRPYYERGQTMHGKLHAAYFFGKVVAGSAVEVQVETGSNVLGRVSTQTDQAGDATFDFGLPRNVSEEVVLRASVTDTAKQKQMKEVVRAVSEQPLRVEVIPEAGTLVQNVSNTIYLSVTYPDGRPARARLTLSSPKKELVTNDLGVASVEITPAQPVLDLKIRAADDQGNAAERQVELQCGGRWEGFLVRPDKAVCDGGDTMRLLALGNGQEPVFIDLIKDGQTILTGTIEIKDGRGEYQVDLAPELFGTVELCAYRFGAEGELTRQTRVLYVWPARQVNIRASLDRAEYRPGETAKLNLTLTDSQGKPIPGALSLTAVDEAVFSVLSQRPGMEQSFFTIEQEMLRRGSVSHPWSPDAVTNSPARQLFDQAQLARAAATEFGRQADDRQSTRREAEVRLPDHSLAVSSYPSKAQETQTSRSTGLERVTTAWGALFALLVTVLAVKGFMALWLYRSRLAVLILLLVAGSLAYVLCIVPLMEPQVPGTFARLGSAVTVLDSTGSSEPVTERSGGIIIRNAAAHDFSNPKWMEPLHSTPPVRVRDWFPETLLWRPELITDDTGHASLDVPLADSITTWRLTAGAVTADGQLGATQASIRVFQPFFVDLNLPVSLTRGNEVSIPVAVYNYLDRPQTVELTLEDATWFEQQGDAVQRVELGPNEVRSVSFRLRVTRVGNQQLQVTARAGDVADAIKRPIEVVSDGRRIEQVFNGTLRQPADLTLAVPADAIEGSPKAVLKIYSSGFSQLVEGLDAIFQMPYGCFEQTSSTTYPNVLALDYLRRNHKAAPEVEARARQYIQLGAQRLLGFEVAGGGFDWFGRPPANRTLTAYGLMEFQDMARVQDVDPRLIERTRRWLLDQRARDGSWGPEGHGMHDDPVHGQDADAARYGPTAYIAWAVFDGRQQDDDGRLTLRYLLARRPGEISDPHILALACNALLGLGATEEIGAYLDRLQSLRHTSPDGALAWWDLPAGARTTFYGAGRSGEVETTALAVLALLKANRDPGTTRAALAWLVRQKDGAGTWHSTQATVLALKALLGGTGKAGGERERRIEISWDKGAKREIVIPADQSDVLQMIDLSEAIAAGGRRLTLREQGDGGTAYQVAFRYHVPAGALAKAEPLSLAVEYDHSDVVVGETVRATATVVNRQQEAAPMVVLDLPIPGGFALVADELAEMISTGTIAKYQANGRSTVVYLRELKPGSPLQVRYRLRATMPVKVTVPAGRAYEYYDADKQGLSAPAHLTAMPGPAGQRP